MAGEWASGRQTEDRVQAGPPVAITGPTMMDETLAGEGT
jgi:hypothetical protein